MATRVLLVDDSILMRRMIRDTLCDIGMEVAGEAASGEEAVRVFKETRPDVVTLDIVMPGTDGMYALENILATTPEARIVVVSALNQTRMISEAIRKGAYDFIAKPFLPEQLQETVRRCAESAAV